MTVVDYLIEKKIVNDLKEFQDLYAIRAFKINDKLVLDPSLEIEEEKIYKIQVGYRIINV
ncbi:MAG: hypothetical protein HPY57_14295 [Ignavibacteria bacterium]|nr:hypothetical protein [Ignavibacteria bacterium]